jgi:hypothetical protein
VQATLAHLQAAEQAMTAIGRTFGAADLATAGSCPEHVSTPAGPGVGGGESPGD